MKKVTFLTAMLLLAASLFGQSHSVTLSCTAGAGTTPTGFNFYRSITSGAEGSTPINSAPVPTCAYTDTAVKGGTQYFYEATEIVDGVVSGFSNEANGTTPVFAPSGVKLTVNGTSGTVTWTASPDTAAAYNAYLGTSAGGESSTPANASPVAAGCSGATCTYTVSNLQPGVTEFVTVRAVLNGVLSIVSNEGQGAVAIPVPQGLTLTVK